MRLLLDTSAFLWIIIDSPELSTRAREAFVDPENEVYLSSVSAWEIVVKYVLGRLPLPDSPKRFVPSQRDQHGIKALPLDEDSALQLARLPMLHKDPFDRMLVCQALEHALTLVTVAPMFEAYPVPILGHT